MFHKSHLQSWINCPWKFKREYVDAAMVVDELRENNFLIGTILHKTANKFWDYVTDDMFADLSRTTRVSQACAVIDPYMRMAADTFTPDGRWGSVIEYVKNLTLFEATRWYNYSKLTANPPLYWLPVYTEIEVTDEDKRRTGTVDRVERIVGRKTYAIVEVKAKIGSNTSNIRRELGWYYLLAQRAWKDGYIDKQITHWGCFGYKTGETFFEEVKRITLTAMEKRFVKFQDAIAKGDYPKKLFGYLCMWCEYLGECYNDVDTWQVKHPHDRADEYDV